MKRVPIALAAAALALAASAAADEPGAGGTRPLVPKTGEEVYKMVCESCHMPGGAGAQGAARFPALASNPRLATPAYAISVIEKGKGGMPWFSDMLTPEQVAAVTNYLRTHFGNNYPQPVTVEDVRAFAKPAGGE
jgi:mono/diheme cytochrome c family protein